jgi:hypothetical protein
MKLKDIVVFTVAWLAMEMCERSPMHCETDQLGTPVMWGMGSSPSDGNVLSIQAIFHTGCPLLPCGFQERAASGKNCSVVATKKRGEEEDVVDIERIISESVMRKPWDATVTTCPEHLFHFTSSATHHLPVYLYLLY